MHNTAGYEQGEDEGGDLDSKGKAEEGPGAVSQRQINRLQQQMVELQAKLKAFYEENQQQAEEIAVWRLAFGPAPTFNQNPSNTDSGTKNQSLYSTVIQPQSNQQQAQSQNQDEVQTSTQSPEDSQRYVTLIREDELFLSCSSNKMQGRTLFSRLQHSNVSEPKNLHPFTKTSSLQEHIQDTAESEKENTCPAQHKQKKDTEHVTKDLYKALGPQQTKTSECPTENPNCSTVNTNLPSNRGVWTDMKSVNTQTEERLYSLSPSTSSVQTQTEEEEENDEIVESPPVFPTPLSEVAASEDKMFLSGSFPIPADPARLAERIRRNRTQLSAAFDDTEYEPYGLPEVVMKGFADIPSGPACPYIVRRGLLGTSVVPAQQKDPGQAEETD
ncbi:centromere protein F-like isoform X2 [Sphaeramia orbicularis]|uniref:centromere protein F-like isoform X2 n=1 Tax=Sphaeramia orbicularis TaxID=375764 RepID=UPI00117CFDBC|nr:centromere protein F-like isoform X2 [Sphaeramia orbicularis]